MTHRWTGTALLAATLSACGGGVEQQVFVETYTEHYCEAWVDCGFTATEVFDGTDSIDDCYEQEADAIAAQWQGCKYKKKKAEQCLESLTAPTCPENGDFASLFPVICNEVWVKCPAGGGTLTGE